MMKYYIIVGFGEKAIRTRVEGFIAVSNLPNQSVTILYLPFDWENSLLAEEMGNKGLASVSHETHDGKNFIVLVFKAGDLYAIPVEL